MVGVLATAVLLFVAQPADAAASNEGRGGIGTVPAWSGAGKTLARVRFGFGGSGIVGIHPDDFWVGVAGGAGIAAEFGVIFEDRFSLFWRGELVTSIGSLLGTNGIFLDIGFGEHLALGIGASLTLWQTLVSSIYDFTQFQGFTFPIRMHYAFGDRAPGVAHRSGWALSAHIGPGFSLYSAYGGARCFQCSAPYVAPFAFTTGIGFGYLSW